MKRFSRHCVHLAHSIVAAGAVMVAAPAQAAITLSSTPLFLAVPVAPNITLTLDDTGSMRRAFVPENCLADTSDCDHLDNRYEKAANRNRVHYNPNVKYPAPKNASGAALTTSFTAAYRNGFNTALGTVNLSNGYRPTAFLDFDSMQSNSMTEAFMGHFASDAQCNTSTNKCQFKNASGSFVDTATNCSGSTTTAKHNSCRAPHATTSGNTLVVSGYYTRNNVPPPVPAYYYVYDGTNASCNGTATDNDCYDLKIVSATSGSGAVDLNGNGLLDSGDVDERQNFANWYSFHRSRTLTTQSAAALAFADLDATVRVAWQAVNSCTGSTSIVDTNCQGYRNNFSSVSNAVNLFTGTHKNNFYNWIFQQPTSGGTALPAAMQRVGNYYTNTAENGPYDNDFSASGSLQHACRRNYHIMMTDGMWTSGVATTVQDQSTNVDLPEDGMPPAGSTEPTIEKYRPTGAAMPPYQSNYANTLADVAFHYWITDLVPGAGGLANIVTPSWKDRTGTFYQQYWNPRNDPATWQHMVNFTIGLGLTGYLQQAGLTWSGDMFGGSYNALALGSGAPGGIAWPLAQADASGLTAGNAADLWHAAINSRGQFFSADDPNGLSTAFQTAINAITGDRGASAALSTNSTSIQPGNTVVYQAKFDRGWSGDLLAYGVDGSGAVESTPDWQAAKLIPTHGTRKIFTRNGTQGINFDSAACAAVGATDFTTAQRDALNVDAMGATDNLCADRVNYLRGDTSKEQRNGGPFRNRPRDPVTLQTNVMGDVINSDPAFVHNIDYGYSTLTGAPGYGTYVAANASRTPMVYVGTNDGKLMAIRADSGHVDSGKEQFAFVPSAVFDNLKHLTYPSYTHHYYVDGGITVRDAYIGSPTPTWRTILVAGLNGGGKSVYALDITDPDTFGAANVLWEFSDADLGYTFSQPQIAVLENGTWVAVFGNGYNSSNGGAYLYVVDLLTGTLLRKIQASDVSATDESNGLSTPLMVDQNGNGKVGTVYAGDLHGNLWRFNLAAALPASWGVAYSGAALFSAVNADSQKQPITAQPIIGGHPLGGTMVYFGTGIYLGLPDVSNTQTQTFYGIRDNGSVVSGRAQLHEQRFDTQVQISTDRIGRSTTGTSVDYGSKKGFYLDLLKPPNPPGTKQGERVASHAILLGDSVLFVSIVPSIDPCQPGGTSWFTQLDAINGGQTPSTFDTDGDGDVDADDMGDLNSLQKPSLGISKTPVLLQGDVSSPSYDPSLSFAIGTGTGDTFFSLVIKDDTTPPPPPTPSGTLTRRYWMQIR